MNRLSQLQETLLQNITDNEDCENTEFVLLDYNSNDGMDDWIKSHFINFIHEGKLNYYKTFEPIAFSHSHSKNMALKLAQGDIICQVNADHFTGKGFAEYVIKCFEKSERIVLTHIPNNPYKIDWTHLRSDLWGKLCLMKSAFINVGGFDEKFTSYGWEDVDIINRLDLLGVEKQEIYKPEFVRFIEHGEDERLANQTAVETFCDIYIHYLSPWESNILFLRNNGEIESGMLVDLTSQYSDSFLLADGQRNNIFECEVKGGRLLKGAWKNNPQNNSISFMTDEKIQLFHYENPTNHECLIDSENKTRYVKVSDLETFAALTKFHKRYRGQAVLVSNLNNKVLKPNGDRFGLGTVYKNFDNYNPIFL